MNFNPKYFKSKLQLLFLRSDCCLCGGTVANQPHKQRTSGLGSNILSVTQQSVLPPIICNYCHEKLPLLKQCCSICALPLNAAIRSNQEQICGACIKQTPPYEKTLAAFHYESPVNEFISNLKFNHQYQVLPLLVYYLLQTIQQNYTTEQLPTELLPVPLFPKKLRQRGFNQASLIAQKLSQQLKVPVNNSSAQRVRNTLSQINLDAIERQKNLKNAFQLTHPTTSHVAIIDDVMTTGTTVTELTKVLKHSGVKRVDVWCLARAFHL